MRFVLLVPMTFAFVHGHAQKEGAPSHLSACAKAAHINMASAGCSLLNVPMGPPRTAPPLLPRQDDGPSTWQSAGVGALIGLGVGCAAGLLATKGDLRGGGGLPVYVFTICAGGGAVLGGLVGLIAGAGSGSGGAPFPGY